MDCKVAKTDCRMLRRGAGLLVLLVGIFVMCGCGRKSVAVEKKGDEKDLWKGDYSAAMKQAVAE